MVVVLSFRHSLPYWSVGLSQEQKRFQIWARKPVLFSTRFGKSEESEPRMVCSFASEIWKSNHFGLRRMADREELQSLICRSRFLIRFSTKLQVQTVKDIRSRDRGFWSEASRLAVEAECFANGSDASRLAVEAECNRSATWSHIKCPRALEAKLRMTCLKLLSSIATTC